MMGSGFMQHWILGKGKYTQGQKHPFFTIAKCCKHSINSVDGEGADTLLLESRKKQVTKTTNSPKK